MADLEIELAKVGRAKLDSDTFVERQAQLRIELDRLAKDLQATTTAANTACNYMDKYSAIYVQRQISQTLNYILPQKDVNWRLNWFNEVKMPLLNSLILLDKGDHHLEAKISHLSRFVETFPETSMNIIQDPD